MKDVFFILALFVTVLTGCQAGFYDCFTNDDCKDERLCCSITPALGKRNIQGRQIPPDWDGTVHYCLPWKNENATWCSLHLQYTTTAQNYHGLCPCGPGLQCTPTDLLDEKFYPKDRFGKCTPVSK
ncbi:uncharacterized protein LOC132744389 [Ruditapes philippinarum]|uniref:uncharacterized protein LOC132744389 n=1 Tax=Ruditapes philippinarum TaxID=129788 RepID=UPI00295B5CB4|nr:uncharacterized protein LOC132744389 [Ruditapes philippinarum]